MTHLLSWTVDNGGHSSTSNHHDRPGTAREAYDLMKASLEKNGSEFVSDDAHMTIKLETESEQFHTYQFVEVGSGGNGPKESLPL